MFPTSRISMPALAKRISIFAMTASDQLETKRVVSKQMKDYSSIFLRLALGISFLAAVADRFGLWGSFGQPNVAWGDFSHFVAYTRKLNCMGSYRRGDPLWDIAHRRLQNTNGLRPLWSSPVVICYGHGHRSWHQDAIRLFGLLGSRCSILTGVLGAGPIHIGQASESITKLSGRSDHEQH